MEDQQNTHAEGLPADGPITTGNALPELSSLTEMVRVMIEDQERREHEIVEERKRRDPEIVEERERHERERETRSDNAWIGSEKTIDADIQRRANGASKICRQMERLQQMITDQSTAVRAHTDIEPVKLTRLTEEDDIEAYLTSFERIMTAHEVSRERWPFKLAPQLTGKAQQAYAALPPNEAMTYDTIKTAILRRYNINEETYRQRFRKLKAKEGESPQELMTRLKDLATRWMRDSASQDDLM